MGLELVVLVGVPCSGKTALAKSYFPNHYHVNLNAIHELLAQDGPRGFDWRNRDLARSLERQIIETRLSENISVVIDNTNLTKEDRARYRPLAFEHDAELYAVCFYPRRSDIIKNNWKRKAETGIFIPNGVIFDAIDRIEMPSLEEGFTQIRSEQYLLIKEKEKK